MKKVILMLALIVLRTSQSQAYENWQILSGPKLAVMLPARAQEVNPNVRIGTSFNLSIDQEISAKRCPATNSIVNRIFNSLVEKNNLQMFINDGPGLGVLINCAAAQASPETRGPFALETTVFLPAYVVTVADYDDEIAAILAHELSHVLLDHAGQVEANLKAKTVRIEAEADILGTKLMANAGYNPRSMKTVLAKLVKFLGAQSSNIFVRLFFDDGHGSLRQRGLRIDQSATRMNSPDSAPVASEDLLAAKREVRALGAVTPPL